MTKVVCTACHCALKLETRGTLVIETIESDVKVWYADTWKCPNCGIEIIAGFANLSTRANRANSDFPEWLEWLERTKSTAQRVEYYDEHPSRKNA